ncbi:hypothetical protein EYF80_060828 [Liparis tanakae]|uniref:Uncharacterized protein n=1 Tax=Liparis tanakae TaxID=230148 RepID=A0A4Z2EJM4_9TELE|nr:hypothetical protein EYF80_060828 [Liparis tanakae]
MEPDPGDVDSPPGGPSLLDRILADSVCQQQGWLRVYGKTSTHARTRKAERRWTPPERSEVTVYKTTLRVDFLSLGGLPVLRWTSCPQVDFLSLGGLPVLRWTSCPQVDFLSSGGLPVLRWTSCPQVDFLSSGVSLQAQRAQITGCIEVYAPCVKAAFSLLTTRGSMKKKSM